MAVLAADDIFATGVPAILHDTNERHFNCLLNADASELHGINDMREVALVARTRGRRERVRAGPCDPTMHFEGHLSDVDLSNVRKVSFAGHALTVHQTWSHSSGKLRFYTKCPNVEHHWCFKYTQRDLHQSDNDCRTWLLAWAKLGMQTPSKEDHKSVHPSEEQSAEARATLQAHACGSLQPKPLHRPEKPSTPSPENPHGAPSGRNHKTREKQRPDPPAQTRHYAT